MRTDGKGYHDSIDRHRMLEMISRHIKDRVVLNYLRQARRCPKLPGPVWLPGKTSDAVPLIGRLLDHLVGAQQHGLRQVDAMRAVLCARVHMSPGAGGKGLRIGLTRSAVPCISERRNPRAANGHGRSFARTDHASVSSAVCRRSRELPRHRAGQLTRTVEANNHRRLPTFKPARG